MAMLNRRDSFHDWSVEQARNLSPPFFTCEAVIAEAHFLLSKTHQGMDRLIDLIATGRLDLSFSLADNHSRVGELMRMYANVPMSFADACLVIMAEEMGSAIFTLDSDFRIYRKNRNKRLRLIIP